MANVAGIGDRLKRARENCGLSLREVAQEYGKTHSAISYWESERSEIPADYVAWLAERTGFAVAWLLYGEGPMMAEMPHEAVVLIDQIREILGRSTRATLYDHPALLAAREGPEPDTEHMEPSMEDETTPTPDNPPDPPDRQAGNG